MLQHIAQAALDDLKKLRRRKRFADPTPLNELFTVYAVYHWHEQRERWDLVAFQRVGLHRLPSQRQMDRLRTKLTRKERKWLKREQLQGIGILQFVELGLAARYGPPTASPYQSYRATRRRLVDHETPKHLMPEFIA